MDKEIIMRKKATGIYIMLKTFLGKKEVPKEIKTETVKNLIRPIVRNSNETWTLSKRQLVNAIEITLLQRIENKTKRDKIRNKIFR